MVIINACVCVSYFVFDQENLIYNIHVVPNKFEKYYSISFKEYKPL